MIQLYFLSVLCNGLTGYILFAGGESDSIEKGGRFSLNNPTFHLVLGVISAVTGFLKLLSPITNEGHSIYLLGDLLPAAAGVTAGLLLIFGIYRQDSISSESQSSLDRLGASLLRFRKAVGLGLVAVALVHFLFPNALFL